MLCHHNPHCPTADERAAMTAYVAVDHSEQGWCLLCNGVIRFEDGGAIFPDGHVAPGPASLAHVAA
ncbi:DUF5999 family protein [Nocardioides pocheonensis]|uniref:Uncharacterized protein n=1 Tax=Nocardioides pocheonensis TaxID=661485 RepID=A0A3N0GJH2_9ACTN|nr:DUF5999 family protein [Nocardioides pocheonensis]RNM12200.1 hypothetical protein EFL26_20580 [Nocardioides pocheonensis]